MKPVERLLRAFYSSGKFRPRTYAELRERLGPDHKAYSAINRAKADGLLTVTEIKCGPNSTTIIDITRKGCEAVGP